MLTGIVTLLIVILSTYAPPIAGAAEESSIIYDVVIVGGGIAGLTAAFYLDEYDILLLEKEKQVGGRTTSGQYKGISYARGTEYLGKPETPLKEIIAALGLSLWEIPAPADVTSYGGSMFYGDYGKTRLLVSKSSRGEFNRFIRIIQEAYDDYEDIPDLELSGELARLERITARQWFNENHFSQIYSDIYNVTFRGLFGANIDEISALSALPEIAFDFEDVNSLDDDNDLSEEFASGRNSTGMYSFDNGIAGIPLALARYLGTRVQTETTVTGVERVGELFTVNCIRADNTRMSYRAESVILATPSVVTLELSKGLLNQEQRQLLGSVSYASYVTIALFSEQPIFNKGFDLAVPDGLIFTDIYDATWIARHYQDKTKAQKNWVTLVYAAPNSYMDNTLLIMSDQQLMNLVRSQLDGLIPGSSGLVKHWEITRFRYGFPVMTPGSHRRMIRLQQILGEGLYFAGDYLIYPTFEAAASSGHLAADKVMDWLED